jgi:ATP-dependent DNA helicase RecG
LIILFRTIKIINECKKAGLPEPIIEKASGGISVTIQKKAIDTLQVTTPVTTPVTGEIKKVILVLTDEMQREGLQEELHLRNKNHFNKKYLQPAIKQGLIEMTIPDKPNSRLQKYRLTEEGKKLKRKLKKEQK